MITAALQGRNLAITVEGIDDPFVIEPLSGRMGKHLTDLYLRTMARQLPPEQMQDVLLISVDGGVWADDGTLQPKPEAERHIWNRMDNELSQAEGQDVLHPAFFWQTVLGLDGVNTYVKAGGGMTGGVKALWALTSTLGISPLTTSPSSELATLIQSRASSSTTTTPSGGSTLDRLPVNKQSRRKSTKKA